MALIVGKRAGAGQVAPDRGIPYAPLRHPAHLGRVELLAASAEHAAASDRRMGAAALRRRRRAGGAAYTGGAGHYATSVAPSLWMALYPPGFIEPCLPTISRTVPTGPQWAYEIKPNGFRFLAVRQGKRARTLARRL